jgi:hypothetical protein
VDEALDCVAIIADNEATPGVSRLFDRSSIRKGGKGFLESKFYRGQGVPRRIRGERRSDLITNSKRSNSHDDIQTKLDHGGNLLCRELQTAIALE